MLNYSSYSADPYTNGRSIYPIKANFRKEIFLNPKATLGLEELSKALEPDSRLVSQKVPDNGSIYRPRIYETKQPKHCSSENFYNSRERLSFPLQYKPNFLEISPEHAANIQDTSESSSINKIPFSPIGLKQMKSPLLGKYSDEKLDYHRLSTEPSIGNLSHNHTPPQYSKMYSNNDLNYASDTKPNSFYRTLQAPKLSVSSMCDLEKKDNNFRTPKAAKFSSDSKDFRTSVPGDLPGDRFMMINSINPGLSTINSQLPQSKNFGVSSNDKYFRYSATMDRETPPKISHRASMDLKNDNNIYPPSKKGSFLSSQSTFRKSNTNFGRGSVGSADNVEVKKSSTSEELRKYIMNLNEKFENFEPKAWIQQVLAGNPRKEFKCSCDVNLDVDKTCSRALGWISKRYKPQEFPYLKTTYERIVSEQKLAEPEQIRQIQKDIHRTFPENKLFAAGSEGVKSLDRILNAIAKYDPNVGYVQGMNFIVGSLLYHAEEYIAFWLMVYLFEFLEMRDIFLPKLPGLSKHCQIIYMLVLNENPEVHSKLCELEIKPEMFCSEWIFTLFSSVVPITEMAYVFDNLVKEGWTFFYKLVLAFLDHFKDAIVQEDDLVGVLTILKSQNRMTLNKNTSKNPFYINWKDLCRDAQKCKVDPEFIYNMHLKFDINNLWFKTTS